MTRRFQGMNAWILQRVSAVYLALFFSYVIYVFIFIPPSSHEEFKLWISNPVMSIAMLLFLAMILGHAWVGIRDVFMDYIPSLTIRAIALMLLAISLFSCGVWVIRIMVVAII